jgi:DNA (cytosine-5)-methyltransferase 1
VEWQVLNSKDFGVPQNRERVFIVGHLGGEPRRKVFPITGTNGDDTQPTKRPLGQNNNTSKPIIPVLAPDRINKHQNGRRFKTDGEPAFTINTQDRHGVYDGARIRRLTPLECERLQGFPDGWTEGISDTQRYKTLGNAVTVNVVEAVITSLMRTYELH